MFIKKKKTQFTFEYSNPFAETILRTGTPCIYRVLKHFIPFARFTSRERRRRRRQQQQQQMCVLNRCKYGYNNALTVIAGQRQMRIDTQSTTGKKRLTAWGCNIRTYYVRPRKNCWPRKRWNSNDVCIQHFYASHVEVFVSVVVHKLGK